MAGTETTILTSSIVVGAIWGYRKLIEPHASEPSTGGLLSIAGVQPAPAPTAQFIPAFAFTYLSLSVIGTFAPDLAKGFAVLIAVADLLANGLTVFNDIGSQTSGRLQGSLSSNLTGPTGVAFAPTGTDVITNVTATNNRDPKKITSADIFGGFTPAP